MEAEWKETENL